LGRFLDKNGDPVLPEIDGRIIGMPLEEVKNIPEKVMAAAGEHKISIILAACQKGFVDTLITDEPTADLLLTEINKRMGDKPSNNR
jgi:DNA-binding transcriptional regulator LsrR (DeoR family)